MDDPSNPESAISTARAELAQLDARRAELAAHIKSLEEQLSASLQPAQPVQSDHPVSPDNSTQTLSTIEKIRLFRSLFHGREDVFPKRFESRTTSRSGYAPACRNEWVHGVCQKPAVKCADCLQREFVPLSNDIIKSHLTGKDPSRQYPQDFIIGVYPMLEDETCWFLAADFDQEAWKEDIAAFAAAGRKVSIPVYIERSRSGNGGHAWIFFSEPVAASLARKLGSLLLTSAMDDRPELGFRSYDRFFPNQDNMPKGGFGNLIALPFQKQAVQSGNTLFLDEHFEPAHDQWGFLASIKRIPANDVHAIVEKAAREDALFGVHLPVMEDGETRPWDQSPSRRPKLYIPAGALPAEVKIVLSNQIYLEKKILPPILRSRLIRFAAFQNPEFYKAQAMRLPVYSKPRIISCCEDFPDHLGLPRGCLDDVSEMFAQLSIKTVMEDRRNHGQAIKVKFTGELLPKQDDAGKKLLAHDTGILAATTAFGKTVLALWLLARRGVNSLIIVHRQQLLDQWIERMKTFLELPENSIGQIGGGKKKPTGIIDVALMQSLIRKGVVADIVGEYGHLIVDECHHISAFSFEQVARRCKAKFVTGLSATLARKDGHQPIIIMQCGPVRYHVSDKAQSLDRPFRHDVIVRKTEFLLPQPWREMENLPIQDVYRLLSQDAARNQLICEEVLKSLQAGRTPVILTERVEHAAAFQEWLSPHVPHLIFLKGGMGKKQRAACMERLRSVPENEPRLIIATGRYLGEGFDDARLDTLFLTMPVSWKGTITQYAGRLHRLHYAKKDVIIYDYVEPAVPVLMRMFTRRRAGYQAMGYAICDE